MNPHAEFIQTIYDNPDDDTPRLVYADWLEENGFVPLAEFIRVQIEINRLGHPLHDLYSLLYEDEIDRIAEINPRLGDLCRREFELWNKRIAWRRMPPRWHEHRIGFYRRGLLDHWSGPIAEFTKYSEELWGMAPCDPFIWVEKTSTSTSFPSARRWIELKYCTLHQPHSSTQVELHWLIPDLANESRR